MRTGSVLVGLTGLAALHAPAQVDKVEQYRAMLLKRPENQVLFGRMMDAWLEQGEMAGLKQRLETQAAAGGPMDWRLLAVFRNFSGDEEGAITALDEALKKSPDDAQTRLARAKALGAASRFEDALKDLEIAAKVPEVAMEAGTLRGKFLARAGRPAEAVAAWKEVIAAHPGDEGLREDLIELEIGEGMLEEAVAAAAELADQSEDPYQKALRRMRVAEILAQAGKKNEAVAKYREVFEVSAESSWLEREVLARVNALFSREDDTAGLRAFYDQLRDAFPRRVVVKKEAARSLMVSGDGDEAVAMFREVLKVMPGDREVRDEFIALLESAGRFKDAADEISALLAASAKDVALWEKLAGIRKQLGDGPGVREAVDKAIALVPEGEAGKISAAAIYERYERPDDAERVLRDAVKTHGLAGEAGDALAVMLAQRGKPDEAVELWKEMAKTADREGLLRIVRSLTANGRAADSYGIIASRMDGFAGDPLLLAALCQAAQFADKVEGAIPQAIELVRQAKTTGDLETALRQATGLVFRAKDPRKWIDELAAKPDKSTAELCLLAEMQETLGDSLEADRILKSALASGDPLLAAAQRVRLFELRGDYAAAITATREWLAMPGGMKTEQVKRIVNLHERSGDSEAALKETENWKRIAPGDKLAWIKRADLLRADGKTDEAVAELRRALAKFGNEEEMRATLAAALSEAGMFPEAWRMYYSLYDEADSPSSKLKWVGSLAGLAATEGKEEELIRDFKRRARDNPSSVVPLLALAEMYRDWLQRDEELQTLSEASRRKPDDISLLHRIADIEEQAGSDEKAETLLTSAIRLQDSPENRRRLSAFRIRSGDSERGLAELLATRGGAGPRETERMVLPLVESSDWEIAVRILTAETARHPDDWRLAYLHAHVLRESGMTDQAFNRFASLLDAKGDLPGVLPLIPANQMKWMAGEDSGVSDFKLFAYLRTITTTSKDRRRMYYGMNQTGLPLPGTVTEARWMALCQALSLAEEPPETRAAKHALLNSGEIAGLEFLKSVHSLTHEDLSKRMMADDADPRLFRWYLDTLNTNPYMEQRTDFKILRKGVEICAKSDPELTLQLMSRLPVEGENGLGLEGAARMVELVSALNPAKRLSHIGSLQKIVFAKDEDVGAATRGKAETLMLAEIKAMQEKNGNPWLASSLALQWMRTGRFDDAAKLLNEDYELGKDPKRNATRIMGPNMPFQGMHRGNMPGSEGKLSLMAALSASVNHVFQSGFNLGNPNGTGSLTDNQKKLLALLGEKQGAYPGQEIPAGPVDLDGVGKMIPQISDPKLRVFLAHATGKPEILAREIANLEKAAGEDSSALHIVAAYYLSNKEDPAKAYAVLAKACQLAKATASRDAMDWQLYQLGVSLAAKPPAGLDLEPARRAVLRLRKAMAFDEDAKRKLADDMKKLGLEEEAKRYTAAPKPIFGRLSAYGYSGMASMGGQQQGAVLQVITTLVSQGKRDAAARRALTELRRLKSASSPFSGRSDHEERQMFELIVSLRLEDEIAKISAPAEGSGFNRRREHAMLLAQLKRPEQALPVLRALAAEKPDDFQVRSALLLTLPKEEQKSYVLGISEGKFDNDRIGNWFNSILERGGTNKIEDFLTNVEMFVLFIEKLKPSSDPEVNLSWVNYIAKDVFNNDYFGRIRLKPLRRSSSGSDKYDEARTKERDALARRLHEAMLRHPQTCEQGFILMQVHREALGTTDEQLGKAARTAVALSFSVQPDEELTRMYGGSRSQMLWLWRTSGGGSSSSGSPENAMDPMAYLMRQSPDDNGGELFNPELLADLTAGESKQAKSFQQCLKIVETPGIEAFNAWKENAKDTAGDATTELIWISRLAFFKKRGEILDAALEFACDVSLGKVGSATRRGGGGGVSEVIALSVSEAEGLEEKTKAIDRVTRRLLGPPEAWELYGDTDRSQNVYAVQMRVSAYQQFCQSFQNDRENMVALARYTAENGLAVGGGADLRHYSGMWARSRNDAEAIVKDWRSSGVFSPGPAPAGAAGNDGATLIEAMESVAGNLSSDVRTKVGEVLLKTEGPDRFWGRFLGAKLANKPGEAMSELGKNAAAFAKWPPRCREGLARVVAKWFPEAEKTAATAIRKMLMESRKTGNTEIRKMAEGYLKDGFPPDMHPYSMGNSFGGMMRTLVSDDTAMAVKVWCKAIEHFEKSQSGFSSSSNGFSRSMAQYASGELLQTLANGNVPVPKVAGFIVLLEKEKPGAASGMFASNSGYYMRQLFDNYQKSARESFAKDKALAAMKADGRPFAGVLLMIQRETDKSARPVAAHLYLMSSLYNSSRVSSSTRPMLLEWVRKDLRKLDADLASAALLFLYSRVESDENLSDVEMAEAREAFASLAKDPRVPLLMRVSTISSFLGRNSGISWLDHPPIAAALSDLLEATIKNGRQWASSESIECLNRIVELKSTSSEDASRVLAAFKANPPDIGRGSGNEAFNMINHTLMSLALRSADKQEVQRLVKGGLDSFKGDLDFMIQLWREDHHEAAGSLIARPGEYHKGMRSLLFERSGGESKALVFTPEIETALPGWLASIPDPVQRFRVECLISAAPDGKKESAPTVARLPRIEALVKRFPAEAPKPRVARSETLAALANEPVPAKALASEYMEAVGKQTMGMMLPLRGGSRSSGAMGADSTYVTEALIIRAMQYSLEDQGDGAFAVTQFESIVPVPSGNQAYVASEMFKSLGSWYSGLLLKRIIDEPAAQRAKLAGQALVIARAMFEKGIQGEKQIAVALALSSQALAGDGAALDRWLEGFPKGLKESFDKSTTDRSLRNVMASLKNPALAGEVNDARRRSLLAALITEPTIAARVIRHPTDLSALLDSGAFSKEDIFAVIDDLPETHPRRIAFLCEKAGIIGWRGGKPEDALKAYDAAAAAAAGDAKKMDYINSYRAMFLDYRNRDDEALAVAKTINLDHLPERERKTVNGILKKVPAKKQKE